MRPLCDDAHNELSFWFNSLHDYKSQPIWHSLSAVGVVCIQMPVILAMGATWTHGHHTAYGQWTADEIEQSSTWLELITVW